MRSLMRLAALATLLAACAPDPASEVVVVIDADAHTRGRLAGLRVEVRGGPGTNPAGWPAPTARMEATSAWPIPIGVVPLDNDASRGFEVRAVAVDGPGAIVGEARVVSGFVRGKTVVLPLRIEAACTTIACLGGDNTCRGGHCMPAYVDPVTLPPDMPASFGGNYMVSTTPVSNGCMIGTTPLMMSSGIGVTVTQIAGQPEVTVDIAPPLAGFFDFYVGSHSFHGVAIANHLTATLTGTAGQGSDICHYTLDAVLDIDLTGDSVSGVLSTYAVNVTGVPPANPACNVYRGCSTDFTVAGMRTP